MKANLRDRVLEEIEEEKEGHRSRRKERLESGKDVKCLDCKGDGIIRLNFLYTLRQLGHGFNRDGTRSSYDKEIECPRCEGQGQFDPEKDKLTQEIKILIIQNT